MFERYTEKARRAIFFARYEASEFGSPTIEAEFLLLGILREDKSIFARWLGGDIDSLRAEIASATPKREKMATSVDLPLSNEAKQVLTFAAEEAERLGHTHIGTEHLFLGLLRDQKSYAGHLLSERGVDIAAVRESLANADRQSQVEALPRSRNLRLRIANEEGEEIASLPWHHRLPTIGESLTLPLPDGKFERYRILDLNWSLDAVAGSVFLVSEVTLKVRKEKS